MLAVGEQHGIEAKLLTPAEVKSVKVKVSMIILSR